MEASNHATLSIRIVSPQYCVGEYNSYPHRHLTRIPSRVALMSKHALVTSLLIGISLTSILPADEHPFPQRVPAPDFPKDAEWLNTGGPLRKQDLRGKFVLLDFWTYCCINCIHILPELKKLERKYANELVVIGVHSAKFETEKNTKNIEEAILRYEIEHPVVNDADHRLWDTYGIRSWPSIVLLDPTGNMVARDSGEFKFEQLDAFLARAMPYYKRNKQLDTQPIRFDLLADRQQPTPLRFPGKVLADESSGRLFITDSNHNRIVVTDLAGKLQMTIGSGQIGRSDGSFAEASFDHPQGVVLQGETLYVADTENHLLRKVDLTEQRVSTIAGTGKQARSAWPGLERAGRNGPLPRRWVGNPRRTAINSPWALWIHDQDMYIAMAGPHQIWKMPLDASEIGPYAGNGREDIVDGPLLPREPYAEGFSSFAQPSGLASDGKWLFVADSEGSSIRAVPFDPKQKVRTLVGTSQLPGGRLFAFGDVDGDQPLSRYVTNKAGTVVRDARGYPKISGVRLQHALGVVYHDGQIYVADTYNNKIKVVDAETGATQTLVGSGKSGTTNDPPQFDEPAGITYAAGTLYVADTNNHLIRTIDVASRRVATMEIAGLAPVEKVERKPVNITKGAQEERLKTTKVQPVDGKVTLQVDLQLPKGWKINKLAPMRYDLQLTKDKGPIARTVVGKKKLAEPSTQFDVVLPVSGTGNEQVQLVMTYYYCQAGGEGLCKVGKVNFQVPLVIADKGTEKPIRLTHVVGK